MPNFPKNKGFKLPGMGSKETDTPGNFRKDQKVENVGYCSDTESHMLPPGSSPLLKRASMIDQVVPEYYKTSYTGNNWPMGKGAPKKDDTSETKTAQSQLEYKGKEYNFDKDVEVPDLTGKGGNNEVPNLVELGRKGKKTDKVRYADLPEAERDAARKYNLEKHGTHYTTELAQATDGKQGFDTSFDYTGDRDEAMRKKRKQMGY